jgi:hypothetical protein
MSEANLWTTMRGAMSPYGKLKRIENSIDKGTPDVTYLFRRYPKVPPVMGWVELKYLDGWPDSDRTKVVVKKLTKDQVDFIADWDAAGGRAYVLIQVGRDYALLDAGTTGALYRRALTRLDLVGRAAVFAVGRFPATELVKALTG